MSKDNERFAKCYRSMIGGPVWMDDGVFKLYMYCLLNASWNAYTSAKYTLQPGDMPFSFRKAADELHWSINKVERKVKQLAETG